MNNPKHARIAFIGLGAMGLPIAQNLIRCGHTLSVYDINPRSTHSIDSSQARVCNNVVEAVNNCEFVITLLPTSNEVNEILIGEKGILNHVEKKCIFIDMTTGDVEDFLKLRKIVKSKNMHFIDSPIARGPDYAARKEILFLVGGENYEVGLIRPILEPICEEVIHCGNAGSGLKTKIINNYLASVNVVAIAEALALAKAAGLDRNSLRKLWARTVAGRGALETVYPGKAFSNDFTPGFSAKLARKDLQLAQVLGNQYGKYLFTGEAAHKMFDLQESSGGIDLDWTALLPILEKISHKS